MWEATETDTAGGFYRIDAAKHAQPLRRAFRHTSTTSRTVAVR